LKIKKLFISGMFGDFTYDLNFENVLNNVIILTAPNGYGKSTILKIIDQFFNIKFDELIDESFNFFEIYFDDQKIRVEKNDEILRIIYGEDYDYTIRKGVFIEHNKKFKYILKNEVPYMKKVRHNCWIDTRDNEILDTKELLDRYSFLFPDENLNIEYDKKLIELLDKDVFFVEADRLNNINYNDNNSDHNEEFSAINTLSESIKRLISDAKEKQYAIAMDQSANFPERVMYLLSEDTNIDIRKVVDKIIEISSFDKNFNKNEIFGNLSLNPNIIGKLKNEQLYDNKSFLMVLSSYLDDVIQRINICSDLAERISLFKKSVNSLLQFKTINIHPTFGLIVEKNSKEKNSKEKLNKEKINKFNKGDFSINLLSSGEKHLIILLGNLIFNTKFGSFVLIDEPEISLHAAWQKKLLGLIEEISRINSFNTLIATHSFTLIDGNWDSTIELAGLVK